MLLLETFFQKIKFNVYLVGQVLVTRGFHGLHVATIIERLELCGALRFRHTVADKFNKLFSSCHINVPIFTSEKEYAVFWYGRNPLDFISFIVFA